MAADQGPPARVKDAIWARAMWTGHLALEALWQPRVAFRSPAAIGRAGGRRVRAMIGHAYRTVPYYRQTMDRLGLRPEDIQTAADLARLPLIDRRDLQHDPRQFVSRKRSLDHYCAVQTGGSSGEPVTVYRNPPSPRRSNPAVRGRATLRRLAGRRWRLRVLEITSPMSPATTPRRDVARTNLLPSSLRVQTRRLTLLDPPAEALQVMNEFRPHLVWSYGSYLEALFLHAVHTQREFHRPGVVIYSGDALSVETRRLMLEILGIHPLANYSAVEAPSIGFECEQHRGFHLNCDMYPLRIVDSAGEEVADGEYGEVVVSNLANTATVLLNYRLGDVAAKLPGSCPCGRSLPRLSFIEGRVGDWIQTPTGERMHPQGIRTLFTDEQEVWQYQVVQRSISHFAVTLVAAPGCDRATVERRIREKFANRLGEGTTVEASFAAALPRTSRGKVLPVIGLRDAGGREPAAPIGAR